MIVSGLYVRASTVAFGAWLAAIAANADPSDEAYGDDNGTAFKHNFASGHSSDWYVADNVFHSPAYRAGWVADNVAFKGSALELKLEREPVKFQPYSGAEYQRVGWFRYGRYEVVMKSAKGSGVVSSFFTHTGAYFNDPHDEVDIEFLGNRPDHVHLGYFTDGKLYGSRNIPLGYDSTEVAGLYAFEWRPDSIRWFVGDTLVYEATPETGPIPRAPGRLIMNIWTGSPAQYAWHGKPTFADETSARYYCASFQPFGSDASQCSDSWRPGGFNGIEAQIQSDH